MEFLIRQAIWPRVTYFNIERIDTRNFSITSTYLAKDIVIFQSVYICYCNSFFFFEQHSLL